ncbi:unnamed protein product [Ectocarpus fasciculatus]
MTNSNPSHKVAIQSQQTQEAIGSKTKMPHASAVAEPTSPSILAPPLEANQTLLHPKHSCCARGYNTAAITPLSSARGKARQPNKTTKIFAQRRRLATGDTSPAYKRKLSTPPPPLISLDEFVSPAAPPPRR